MWRERKKERRSSREERIARLAFLLPDESSPSAEYSTRWLLLFSSIQRKSQSVAGLTWSQIFQSELVCVSKPAENALNKRRTRNKRNHSEPNVSQSVFSNSHILSCKLQNGMLRGCIPSVHALTWRKCMWGSFTLANTAASKRNAMLHWSAAKSFFLEVLKVKKNKDTKRKLLCNWTVTKLEIVNYLKKKKVSIAAWERQLLC